MQPDVVFVIAVLILSVVLHEVSHGYVAEMLGDPTARLAGRLTLNPLRHLDPLGSVILPLLLVFSGAKILVGWAKPVPYNPYNLSNQRYGEALVAGAGPAVNIALALFFGMALRFLAPAGLSPAAVELASVIVYVNLLLAFFNLVPIPPLDGSKVLLALLPYRASFAYRSFLEATERYGLIAAFGFLLLFFFFLWPYFFGLLSAVFSAITGLPLP